MTLTWCTQMAPQMLGVARVRTASPVFASGATANPYTPDVRTGWKTHPGGTGSLDYKDSTA